MPRKSLVDKSVLLQTLKYFREIFSEDGELKTASHPVWKSACSHPLLMKKHIVNESVASETAIFKPKQLHDYVYQNRYNLLNDLRAEFGFPSMKEEISYDSSDAFSSSDNDFSEDEDVLNSKEQTIFNISIPFDEYLKMKPSLVIQKEGSCKKRRRVLRKGAWTNILNDNFYKEYELPCAYSFKRNKVRVIRDLRKPFFFAEGHCKECKLPITVTAQNEPSYPDSLELIIKATDTRGVPHHKKVCVVGSRRSEIAKELLNTAPSNWRREKARKLMKFGQSEPPTLPSLSVCRKIRSEAKSKEYGIPQIKNVFLALQKMKYSSEYAGSIHTISFDKFFVHYWSKQQNFIYKMNAKTSYNKVHLDATGSLVKKIKDDRRTSNHIFLYEIVIHFENKAFSVSQMLSESHDTATIEYWLNKWIKDTGKIPKESITDFSLALIGASCRSFNECSITYYLKSSLSILRDKNIDTPQCYLRIDVAHLIKFVSKWNCYEGKSRLVRKFYIRCVALMVKCTAIRRLEEIILNTLILCKSEACGYTENQETSNSEKAKLFLGNCIEREELDSFIHDDSLETDNEDSNADEIFEIACQSDNWFKAIIDEADLAAVSSGSEPNPYFCPKFEKKLVNILPYCPLWTAVMKEVFQSPNTTASSAIIECDFSILKEIIMEHNKRPLRVDKFIAFHLRALSGNSNIIAASANENAYFSNNDKILNDLEEEEAWRGKNTKKDSMLEKISENDKDTHDSYQHKKFFFAKHAEKRNVENNSKLESQNRKTETQLFKPKKSTYLTPNPNIKFVLQSPTSKRETLQIIKNGNLLEPVQINGFAFKVSNACPFDAIMHSLAVICVENDKYMKCAINSTSDFFKCLQMYIQNGVSKKLYEFRTQILAKIYKVEESAIITKMRFINAVDSIGNVINKLFVDMPSATEISQCSNPACSNNKETNLKFWPINLKNFNLGLENFTIP